MKTVCNSWDQLKENLRCDPANLPTVESTLRNIVLPIGQDDVDFLSGIDDEGTQVGVDFFSNPQEGQEKPGTFSRSPGIIRSGMRFRTDFVLDSICIMLHAEPNAWALDGNKVTPQSVIDLNDQLPESPDEALDSMCINATREGRGHIYRCNAQMEHGGPTVRAAHWALQAYRLALQCPSAANVHEIMNERLSDLGNCCLGTNYEGYGHSFASEIEHIRVLNTRLKQLRDRANWPFIEGLEGPTVHNYDPGYFMPFNMENWRIDPTNGECVKTPARMVVASEAYGGAQSSTKAQKWFRLPMPRVIKRDENIEIMLKVDPGDKMFLLRMLHELAAHICLSAIPGITHHTIHLTDGIYSAYEEDSYSRFPSGMLRFGIGLRGFILDADFCSGIKDRFDRITLAEFRASDVGVGRAYGPMSIIGSGPRLSAEQVLGQ